MFAVALDFHFLGIVCVRAIVAAIGFQSRDLTFALVICALVLATHVDNFCHDAPQSCFEFATNGLGRFVETALTSSEDSHATGCRCPDVPVASPGRVHQKPANECDPQAAETSAREEPPYSIENEQKRDELAEACSDAGRPV